MGNDLPAHGMRGLLFGVRSSRDRQVVLGLLVAALLAGCGDEPLHRFFLVQRLPLVFAHRGGGGVTPESTLDTFLAAHARNPEAVIEFDVHRSSDGHIVVIHDDTVDRTTNGSGQVTERTLAELQALDAGYCATPGVGIGAADEGDCHAADPSRFPFRGQGYRIPTMDEVFAALPMDTFISVELKQPGIEPALAAALRASGHMDHLIVGSEHDDVAVRLKDLLPELPHYYPTAAATCLALTAKTVSSYAACPHYEAFASPLSGAGLALDTRGVLNAAHRDGVAVIYWTIDEHAEMERLFRLGADGIYSDYPADAFAVLDGLRGQGVLP
jgi:glycerophosphoryl diester phosphodiesterase